jgi:hypothetical protein
MPTTTFPAWRLDDAPPSALLRQQGFALLSPDSLAALAGHPLGELDALRPGWRDLPPDQHLRDGGRYRFRRHASLILEAVGPQLAPPRPHWQPLDYNALHGGVERWFAPCHAGFVDAPAFRDLVAGIGRVCAEVAGAPVPFVEVHQFRITTADGIGRPTPEGAHRDGVDFVAVLLVERHAVRGGETRVFEADGPAGLRFTMQQPWTALLLDDARVIHETTPLQPDGEDGHRDTLVLTFRRDGFLDPPR